MTGKELIIYILSNDLENEPVFKNGKFIGFLSLDEVAAKYKVGIATVKVWISLGWLDAVEIGDTLYVLPTATAALDERLNNRNSYTRKE